MRIFVNSAEGGKPFEVYSNDGSQPGHVGWYYQVMEEAEGTSWGYDLVGHPVGPFPSLTLAFNNAINCNFCDADTKADSTKVW